MVELEDFENASKICGKRGSSSSVTRTEKSSQFISGSKGW
jgi:hypothetical protein